MKKSEIKSAIARVFTAIINADGIVSMKELEYLENELKPKYNLSSDDFEKSKNLTFAEAVQLIKTVVNSKFKYEVLVDDIDSLAKIDGNVHPKEALLCLALRHTVDDEANYLNVKLVSCGNTHLKFSKKEVIFVESEYDEYINEVIAHNYDAIEYILQSFGFQFIYIPNLKERFQEYTIEYQKETLKYLYPYNNDTEEMHKSFVIRLNGATTEDFTNMLFSNWIEGKIRPSLLIKIASTQARNRDTMTDFLLLDVEKNGFLTTIQRFLNKYDSLSGKTTLLVQRGRQSLEFNSNSFHRTFVEYLNNMVSEIEIHLDYSHKPFIQLGSMGKCCPPAKSLALYITFLYYCYKGIPFTKDWVLEKQLYEQMTLFYKVYQLVTDGSVEENLNKDEKGKQKQNMEDFYKSIQVDYNKLKDCFGNLPNKYLHQFAPSYFKSNQVFRFTILLPVKFVFYSRGKKLEESVEPKYFMKYIDDLSNKY